MLYVVAFLGEMSKGEMVTRFDRYIHASIMKILRKETKSKVLQFFRNVTNFLFLKFFSVGYL